MKNYLYLIALVTAVMYGCQKSDNVEEQGLGKIAIACDASDDIVIAPQQTRAITAPAGTDFRLTMSGTSVTFSQSWNKVSLFDPEVYYAAGAYKAVVEYGDINEEGANKPYFKGEKEFTVVARRTTAVTIDAKIANSLVKIECTDNFRSYLSNATFTLTTAATNTFTFYNNWGSDTSKPDSTEPIFVKPAAFSIVGSAYKQKPAAAIEAEKVDIPQQNFTAVAQKQHVIKFDVSTAGKATLNITFDDTIVETIDIDVELNDDAK